jgi:ACR3 family arsenite efflux pump ArsB
MNKISKTVYNKLFGDIYKIIISTEVLTRSIYKKIMGNDNYFRYVKMILKEDIPKAIKLMIVIHYASKGDYLIEFPDDTKIFVSSYMEFIDLYKLI